MADAAPAVPAVLDNLPQDLRQITPAQFEAWVRHFAATRPLAGRDGLRAYQAVQQSQIAAARGRLADARDPGRKDLIERGLANCEVMFAVAACAVGLKAFGDDGGWWAHAPEHLRPEPRSSPCST